MSQVPGAASERVRSAGLLERNQDFHCDFWGRLKMYTHPVSYNAPTGRVNVEPSPQLRKYSMVALISRYSNPKSR